MRLLNHQPAEISNETITSHHLYNFALSNPEVLDQVATLWRNDSKAPTVFTSLLADRGLSSGDLFNTQNPKSKSFKVVGNRKVTWKVEGFDQRKGVLTRDAVCDYSSAEMGANGSIIQVYVDTNWFSPKDVIELSDNRTFLHISDDRLPSEAYPGEFLYLMKLITKDPEEYVDPNLLKKNMEIGFSYTMFEEMSETAYEKYTFHESAYTHMTIQRMKWSMSGTAEAMSLNKVWMEHNGQKVWSTHAEMQMLRRWAQARENQIIFGRGTVNEKDQILLKDLENREIVGGDGILFQGDEAFRMQYRTLTKKVLQNVMKNMQLFANNEGITELGVICGQDFYWDFQEIMNEIAKPSAEVIVEGTGSSKGVNQSFAWYEYGGVRFVPRRHPYFNSPTRPGVTDVYGRNPQSGRAIFVSLGNVDIQKPNVQLLALGKRAFLSGEVNGINKGGVMANSVDGMHRHILSESGVALMNLYGVAELYKPIRFS